MKFLLIMLLLLTSCSTNVKNNPEKTPIPSPDILEATPTPTFEPTHIFDSLNEDPIQYYVNLNKYNWVKEIETNIFLIYKGPDDYEVLNLNEFKLVKYFGDLELGRFLEVFDFKENYLSFNGCTYYYLTNVYDGDNCGNEKIKKRYGYSTAHSIIHNFLVEYYYEYNEVMLSCFDQSTCDFQKSFPTDILVKYLETTVKYIENNYTLQQTNKEDSFYSNILDQYRN
ncbi:hypothetical protein [Anaerorhabdus sp.]|jgi:hypothetical protein|uniref:hypothetical protein n=1 Tax=Anaerorhabdus sp. TaxID=1872524 RepID=UPI002FCAD29D